MINRGTGKAVIVVDLVNDFVIGRFGSEAAVSVAERTAEFLRWLSGRIPVIFTMDTHIMNDPEFRVWGEHCLAGTDGCELYGSLKHIDGYRVRKRHFDSFYDSDLDGLLRAHNVGEIYVLGISTDICVLHTAAGGFYRNFRLNVIGDLCSSIDPGVHERALEEMKRNYGARVITLEEARKDLA